MRARSLVFATTMLISPAVFAQTRESQSMLPPSPFDHGATPQKIAPPVPPPWDEPLSVSGVDVVTPLAPPPAVASNDQSARIAALERRIAEVEKDHHQSAHLPHWVEWLRPSLLIQPQLIWNVYNAAASPNSQGGTLPPGIGSNDVTATPTGTTNPDFFRLRRARIGLDFVPSEYARFIVEIEPVPRDPSIPGSATIARQIEAIARFPVSRAVAFDLGAGSFEVPFGGEWREHHADRPLIERSYFQQNIFPGDFDLGIHAGMITRFIELEVATINGRTFGELDHGGSLDLNRPKDGVATARLAFGGIAIDMSAYLGEGQLVDGQNLRFKQYMRLGYDVDVALHHRTRLGRTRAMAELFTGSNMDRGVIDPGNLPVMPADLTQDVANRVEVGALVRVDQDLGRFITLGAAYDYYSPDMNLSNDTRHTFRGVVAMKLIPELQVPLEKLRGGTSHRYFVDPRIQIMLEYDHAIDTIRASGPQGAEKQIDTVSFVLQGRL